MRKTSVRKEMSPIEREKGWIEKWGHTHTEREDREEEVKVITCNGAILREHTRASTDV